ncbi:unnamed protein product [Bemisia tabaci]|uniref:Uncharacterized protein n=1 Tax=Bemisia tabaci TaxID=7038 RepID=A0A9P0AM22_BEMTA|nr:unnamed protein product [Bemisia tabaci]
MVFRVDHIFSPFLQVQKHFRTCIGQRCVSYQQGQSPEPKVREYFYFIDHQGMLFLDDAKMKNFTSCFKEKKFLQFFFSRLRRNETGRYPEFPYVSPCGRERNFIRCDDLPIVFTHVIRDTEVEWFGYNNTGDTLKVPFEPTKIYMAENGRIYHPAEEKHGSVGLIQSKLAIEFSKLFKFKEDSEIPFQFEWNNQIYDLDSEWFQKVGLKRSDPIT